MVLMPRDLVSTGLKHIPIYILYQREVELLSSTINKHKDEIIDSVKNNPVVVIRAETGVGKTTKVPAWFVDLGYKVTVTQPRRLAARTNATYVARKFEEKVGKTVGYRTGYERCDSAETRLLYCTDGLELVREITGYGKTDILFIDEVHEWNVNIEGLIAWAKKMLTQKWGVKVVLMSATMDAEKHNFPVEKRLEKPYNIVSIAKECIAQKKNVLIFRPGKAEILRTIDDLHNRGAIVLPLHSEITVEEQNRCFERFDRPKVIVATKIAATSITIPDIDVVIDDGLDKSIRLFDGVEGLYEVEISKADCLQRAGRAGRTKAGTYFLCSDVPIKEREEFPIPEICCVRLDQLCLRLLNAGVDPTTIEFFHQPDINTLLDAKRSLNVLGAIDESNQVTEIGKAMSKMPVDAHLARMIVEGSKRGVAGDMITMAAILQFGGIRDHKISAWKEYTDETKSDALADLDVFKVVYGKLGSLGDAPAARSKFASKLLVMGIKERKFWGILQLRSKLLNSLSNITGVSSSGDRQAIKISHVSGMVDNLYKQAFRDHYQDSNNNHRKMAQNSVVSGYTRLIVGTPMDIKSRNSESTFKIISMVTEVDKDILKEAAPHLFKKEKSTPEYNWFDDTCTETTRILFNGLMISEEESFTLENNEDTLAGYLTAITIDPFNSYLREDIKGIIIRNAEAAKAISMPKDELKAWYLKKLNGAKKIPSAEKLEDLLLPQQTQAGGKDDSQEISVLSLLQNGGKFSFFS